MASFPGGSISGNIIPSNNGQDLGTPNFRWDAYLQQLDAQAATHLITGDLTVDGNLSVTENLDATTTTIKNLNGTVFANQYPTVQDAYNAIPSGGGVLYVPAGTYGTLAIDKSNVTVRSDQGAILTSTDPNVNVITVAAGLTDVTIDGLTVIGGGKTIDEPNFNLGNCIYVMGVPGNTCQRIHVKNCHLSNGHNAIYYQYVNNGSIGNNFINFYHAALAEIELDGSNNCSVYSNSMSDTGGTANACYVLTRIEHGAIDDPCSGNVLTNNYVSGSFSFESFNCFQGYNIFSNNDIQIIGARDNSSGVVCQNAPGPSASRACGNVISDNNITISGTGGTGNSGVTITDGGTGFLPFDNIVCNNVITMNTSASTGSGGIVIHKAEKCIAQSNRITNTSGMFYGISIEETSSADHLISNNLIEGTSSQGIRFVGTNISILSNTIISPGDDGIFLDTGVTGDNCTIALNTVRNGTSRGMSLSDNGVANVGVFGNNNYGNALADSLGSTNAYRFWTAPAIDLNITPTSVAAQTAAEQTFTVAGVSTLDVLTVNPPAMGNAIAVASIRPSTANQIAICFSNASTTTLTPAAGIYRIFAIRS